MKKLFDAVDQFGDANPEVVFLVALGLFLILFTLWRIRVHRGRYQQQYRAVPGACAAIFNLLARSEGTLPVVSIIRALAVDPGCVSCRAVIDAALSRLESLGQIAIHESLDAEMCVLTPAGRAVIRRQAHEETGIVREYQSLHGVRVGGGER